MVEARRSSRRNGIVEVNVTDEQRDLLILALEIAMSKLLSRLEDDLGLQDVNRAINSTLDELEKEHRRLKDERDRQVPFGLPRMGK